MKKFVTLGNECVEYLKTAKASEGANKEHLQREQAVAERQNKKSAAAGGTYYTFLSFCLLAYSFMLADVFLSCCLLFPRFCRIY
jgi:hypothetical protein